MNRCTLDTMSSSTPRFLRWTRIRRPGPYSRSSLWSRMTHRNESHVAKIRDFHAARRLVPSRTSDEGSLVVAPGDPGAEPQPAADAGDAPDLEGVPPAAPGATRRRAEGGAGPRERV